MPVLDRAGRRGSPRPKRGDKIMLPGGHQRSNATSARCLMTAALPPVAAGKPIKARFGADPGDACLARAARSNLQASICLNRLCSNVLCEYCGRVGRSWNDVLCISLPTVRLCWLRVGGSTERNHTTTIPCKRRGPPPAEPPPWVTTFPTRGAGAHSTAPHRTSSRSGRRGVRRYTLFRILSEPWPASIPRFTPHALLYRCGAAETLLRNVDVIIIKTSGNLSSIYRLNSQRFQGHLMGHYLYCSQLSLRRRSRR